MGWVLLMISLLVQSHGGIQMERETNANPFTIWRRRYLN
jgi:hypothetical protein